MLRMRNNALLGDKRTWNMSYAKPKKNVRDVNSPNQLPLGTQGVIDARLNTIKTKGRCLDSCLQSAPHALANVFHSLSPSPFTGDTPFSTWPSEQNSPMPHQTRAPPICQRSSRHGCQICLDLLARLVQHAVRQHVDGVIDADDLRARAAQPRGEGRLCHRALRNLTLGCQPSCRSRIDACWSGAKRCSQ